VLAVKQGGTRELPAEQIAWKTFKAGPTRPSFLLVGNELYTFSDKGFAACADARTGKQHWQERLGGDYSASPTYADGRIYISDQDGKTHVITPGTEFHSEGVNTLEAGCMASPAIVGDTIYLRTKKALYAISKK
jgi:outer membrane protein assembly factor BamB